MVVDAKSSEDDVTAESVPSFICSFVVIGLQNIIEIHVNSSVHRVYSLQEEEQYGEKKNLS